MESIFGSYLGYGTLNTCTSICTMENINTNLQIPHLIKLLNLLKFNILAFKFYVCFKHVLRSLQNTGSYKLQDSLNTDY